MTLLKTYQHDKFMFLMFALILMIFIAPYLIDNRFGEWVLVLTSTLVLVTIVFTMLESEQQFLFACCLVVGITTLQFFNIFHVFQSISWVYRFLLMFFYIYTITRIFKLITKTIVVTRDTVFAALSIYMLIGVAYANAYSLVELTAPGSFTAISPLQLDNGLNYIDMTYFSFTTLTTSGFGDIIPVNNHARSIVILEEITGVLYLAVLVARLVAGMQRPRL